MPLVSLDTLKQYQLDGLLRISHGENLDYELWKELHSLDLVATNMASDNNVPVMDVLTDKALEILGELTK